MQAIQYPYNKGRNSLLIKNSIGQTKLSTYKLPSLNFTYGKPIERDKEGVKEETRDQLPIRNFAQLNKMAMRAGAHQSHVNQKFQNTNQIYKDYFNFRKRHNAWITPKKGKLEIEFGLPDTDFRYGCQNRAPTPINYVVGNMYGLNAEIKQISNYQSTLNEVHENSQNYFLKKNNLFKPILTRTNKATELALDHYRKKLQDLKFKNEKEYFKLNKFKKTKPRTNTGIEFISKSQIQLKEAKQSEINQNA